MEELFLDPQGFESQIASFASTAEVVKELKYTLEAKGVRLQSIDKYMECVDAYNELIVLVGQMLDKDKWTMMQINAGLIEMDSSMANKTLSGS